MENEDVIFVGVCDLAGHLRGKAFPARLRKGMGYTGSSIMMSAFGPIYDSPFKTEGESRPHSGSDHQGRCRLRGLRPGTLLSRRHPNT
jgi:hypothetical protein